MELSELPDYLFHGPRDLETIILTGNLFDELPDDLDLAPNLRELVLDENPIGNLIGEKYIDIFLFLYETIFELKTFLLLTFPAYFPSYPI